MIRLFVVAVAGLGLFFPAYWALHPLLGPEVGTIAAAITGFLIIPTVLLRVWKVYPELLATPVEPNDPIMRQCVERSRAELHRFEKGLKESQKEAYVKYAIQTGDDFTEHVWGLAHEIRENGVVVTLAHEPIEPIRDADDIHPRTTIPMEHIEDWMLIDGEGKCEGGYTHLALAKIYKRLYGKFPRKYLKRVSVFVDIDWSELDSD